MSNDPSRLPSTASSLKSPSEQRQAEKYSNPIPGREDILEQLSRRGKPASREELEQALHIHGEEQQEALRRRLRAMERDGQVIFTRRQCYALPEKLDLLKGTVIGHRDGYGFLRVQGILPGQNKDDLFLPAGQMRTCMHGDVVLAQALGTDKRGRREARIVRVLEARSGQIVGRFFTDAGAGFVVPDDSRLSFDILIPPEEIHGARMGFIVVVALTQRPTARNKAIGKITEVLGDKMGTSMAVDMALRTHEIPYCWSDEVKQHIAGLSEQVPESAKTGRVDLRDLPLVTIDGEDARDFDDAVHCKKKPGGGWRLWVAIADVSYYVRPHTALDDEACKRGTSVYFPSQVVPMLPEVLSNGLCSLNPQTDRLCLVCEMTVSARGRLSGFRFYEAVMNSHARLTYNKVWHILQGDEALREHYRPLVGDLEELQRLYQALDQERTARGGIGFESEEAKFIFNAERRIDRIEIVERNDAHKMIEESMILANICAARLVEKHHEPALFRVHDRPTSEAVTAFRKVLSELGLSLPGGETPQPADYAHLLRLIAERPNQAMLQTMLLRSMKQAIYDPENRGHFGLALTSYAHFTSPIRRYPDLLLHRAIKFLLAQPLKTAKKPPQSAPSAKHTAAAGTPTGGWHYGMAEMLQLGAHCSATERRADEATRDVADWLKCDYMQDHIGETYNGMISSVTAFGFFVRLNDLFIDGLVHVSSLENDYYHYDPTGQRLLGQASGQIYQLGDQVTVRVEGVNMDERKIDFSIFSSQRTPQRSGKTRKDRAQKAAKKGGSAKENKPGKARQPSRAAAEKRVAKKARSNADEHSQQRRSKKSAGNTAKKTASLITSDSRATAATPAGKHPSTNTGKPRRASKARSPKTGKRLSQDKS